MFDRPILGPQPPPLPDHRSGRAALPGLAAVSIVLASIVIATTAGPPPGEAVAAPSGGDTSTAQGVAEACARMGRLAHMGGNGGMMEGIGMASTPAAAIRNCCFYGKIAIQDKGVAQGSNGMWYACIRGR